MKFVHIFLLLLAAVSFGCKQDVDSSSNDVVGDLVGNVNLIDYRGRMQHDASGVKIECEGLPYYTYSDSNGNWTLHNIPTRNYALKYSKEGYIPWEDLSVPFIGGGISRYDQGIALVQPPRYTITLDAIVLPQRIYLDSLKRFITKSAGMIFAHTSPDAPDSVNVYANIYCSHTPNIDRWDTTTFQYSFEASGQSRSPHDTIVSITNQIISYSNYDTSFFNIFPTGDTVYIRAYPQANQALVYDPSTAIHYEEKYSVPGSNVLFGVMQ